ncbi:gamma-glutamylcyclotransferase family protein [Rhodospira trueperi]|uniref:Gamma-glutamyl cyclotransferase, AIG2-like n=1 Tax=Rhodospira trueperi TaxID=69960 RepID=A0A1G7HEL0_9PROT|nr:gamma-glutamylcyclotransferase family protein [Rhodospira trueperi]SDE98922.1 hypothetical protein SAMN05421720_12026 [Rhodospira trueperi]
MARLYLAYGSNLSTARMAGRCPAASPVRPVTVAGWRLRFDKVATIERAADGSLPAALYRITAGCERTLDTLEGVTEGRYRRVWLTLPAETGGDHRILSYIKIDARRGPPTGAYVRHIAAGYDDWGHDLTDLVAALRRCRPEAS